MTEQSDALMEITDAEMVAPSPREQIERATEEATVLADIIEKTKLYSYIQGRSSSPSRDGPRSQLSADVLPAKSRTNPTTQTALAFTSP